MVRHARIWENDVKICRVEQVVSFIDLFWPRFLLRSSLVFRFVHLYFRQSAGP